MIKSKFNLPETWVTFADSLHLVKVRCNTVLPNTFN